MRLGILGTALAVLPLLLWAYDSGPDPSSEGGPGGPAELALLRAKLFLKAAQTVDGEARRNRGVSVLGAPTRPSSRPAQLNGVNPARAIGTNII
jgi:hypothetical protein